MYLCEQHIINLLSQIVQLFSIAGSIKDDHIFTPVFTYQHVL
jgi:hypothetical protein